MMRMMAGPVALVATLSSASPLACTLCHSRTAEDVRAAIFGADFWGNVGALFSPVPVFLLAVFLVRKISP